MAAVSPPRSVPPSSPNATRRKPIPSSLTSSPERTVSLENASHKPLPVVPLTTGALFRDAPVSPVRVSHQTGTLPSPSNAHIELAPPLPDTPTLQFHHTDDRDLPRTPEAPSPPPHSPRYQDLQAKQDAQTIDKPLPPVLNPEPPVLPQKELPNARVAQLSGNSQGTPVASPEPDDGSSILSPSVDARFLDPHRQSRESDTTSSTTPAQTSTESSGATSASSVNEHPDCTEDSGSGSPESSVLEGSIPRNQSVPGFQYHHNAQYPPRVSSVPHEGGDLRAVSNPDLLETGTAVNRHLTPSQQFIRRSSLPRPNSAYSIYSDYGPRGRSPNLFPGGSHVRAPSVQSRRSPDLRPSSYAELLNVPYPQPPPAPISFDNSHLKSAVGNNAALLSSQKTLDMYRQNVKKTNDYSIQYSFAVFLISTAQEMGLNPEEPEPRKPSPQSNKGGESPSPYPQNGMSPYELVKEARSILQRLANNGYPFAQYYLADGYASGLFSKGKEDYNTAFPLFILAAKHGHAESAYRAALCYEFGWGCRKDPTRAVQFLRVAATKSHPGAMTRLGRACLSGDLGERRYREGLKWLKLATEAADTINNSAPYHLGCLYETGYGDDIFLDENYAAELFTQAAELGHAEANYRMGDAYEHGKLNCPRDPALSVHFYTGAAEKGHPAAMMGLCAWYMVGAEPILEKDEEEAYEWARRSAELGYVKAQYAVGYFTEMGIGCRRDILEANVWYVKAADAGDERAKQRIATINAAIRGGQVPGATAGRSGKIKKQNGDDKECIVM
ncbi:hypothetical protein jhhlp_007148 [Lomentospora prolificans]|uniref:Uncharacterized protein n=1 Tax=Lomentospora prolificans TaxID=41688 RepID=A0A2N3N1U9_9PEZI|nr:hypothetical protein jhhlp_007148 [Lomentospora prolificans]